MRKPKLRENVDLTNLRCMVIDHMRSFSSGEYHEDSDEEHYLYEELLEAFYGKDVWKYINSKI